MLTVKILSSVIRSSPVGSHSTGKQMGKVWHLLINKLIKVYVERNHLSSRPTNSKNHYLPKHVSS